MVEGSLWVYGHTRLADFYEGRLSLRELYNRLCALPDTAPLWSVLRAEEERKKAQQETDDIDDALAPFQPRR